MFQVNRKRDCMNHNAARLREFMHCFEDIVLVDQVLGGPMIGHQTVAGQMLFRHAVEIQIQHEGADPAVDIDAMIGQAERLV